MTGTWLLALTGSRLGEVVELKLSELDEAGGCFRLEDTKEGASVRPIGRPAFDVLAKAGGRERCPMCCRRCAAVTAHMGAWPPGSIES